MIVLILAESMGEQIGKYHVNLQDLDNVGAEAMLAAVENCNVIAIDEIGPMELFSEKFKEAGTESAGKSQARDGYCSLEST